MSTPGSDQKIRLVITQGEPAGIGLDLLADTLFDPDWSPRIVWSREPQKPFQPEIELTVLADQLGLLNALKRRQHAKSASLSRSFSVYLRDRRPTSPVRLGQLNRDHAPFVLSLLDEALAGLSQQEWDGIVTLPVHKGILNDAGLPFSGHTEYLSPQTPVLMLFHSPFARLALATTHVPLKDVPTILNPTLLETTLNLLGKGLERDFGVARPRMAILGLNPHAGEGGYIGQEEIAWIAPLIQSVQQAHPEWSLTGPVSADTAFIPSMRERFDAFLSLYHDQALPVLKSHAFDETVNVTLGLPFVRTSPDHGPALDLAAKGQKPSSASFKASIQTACEIIAQRKWGSH